MFTPLGFFLPCIWDSLQKFRRCIFCVVGVIVLIELIQLFTLLGSCDIDDLILNVVGAAAGYWLFMGLHFLIRSKGNRTTDGGFK